MQRVVKIYNRSRQNINAGTLLTVECGMQRLHSLNPFSVFESNLLLRLELMSKAANAQAIGCLQNGLHGMPNYRTGDAIQVS